MPNPTKKQPTQTKYRWIKAGLQILIIILLVTVTVIPGALRLLYRADAQVALGHAKSVRLALQVTGKESYGRNDTPRREASRKVSEKKF